MRATQPEPGPGPERSMSPPPTEASLRADLASVARIDAIPTILSVVCTITKMGFAAVARVTEDRWIACSVQDDIDFGLKPGGELQLETTLCNEIRAHGRPVAIDHVAADPQYCGHHTPARYGFQSYISLPIVLPNGEFFGTLCAIDPKPARVDNPETIGMFKLFAELIAFHLDAQQKMEATAESLVNERKSSELREQFIAVLGHDLRNPLAAIAAGSRILLKTPLNDQARDVLALMQGSIKRMTGLIDNVMDFARGRLGGGLTLDRKADGPLEPTLLHVVDELQSAWPDRVIDCNVQAIGVIDCDSMRVAQLLSNLLSNALTHGAPNSRVSVDAAVTDDRLQISVANAGESIPAAVLEKLFHPFVRASSKPLQQGLGLGLYIASEIARAHGGTLTATSSREVTRFTFDMPVG
jgi:signal transduction histidine kinase